MGDRDRFHGGVTPKGSTAMSCPKMAESLTDEQCSQLCIQLSAMTAEVVVTQIANPDLVDKLPIGSCVAGVNGMPITECEYDEAMDHVKSALPTRPLTLQFTSPDGVDMTEHTFEEPGPLMLRFSHRIKFLNDQLMAVETKMLTITRKERKELKVIVEQMETAINTSATQYAQATAGRTRRKSMADMGGMDLDMPELAEDAAVGGAAGGGAAASGPEPGTGGALVAAGAPVGERLIALRARVEELEAENTDLKAEVEAKGGGGSFSVPSFGF